MSLRVAARRGRGPAVVLLHGFGQDHRAMAVLAEGLEDAHTVLSIDLPRHGEARAIGGSFEEDARALAAAVEEPAVWIGYSMGGRYALRVAIAHPSGVRGLITLGATAGIEDAAARARRVADDEALAVELEREGVARFFERWLARPMFAGLSPEQQLRAVRESQDAQALAASLRRAGTGAMRPLWSRLGELHIPVTLLAGARDVAFAEAAARMARAIGGRARAVLIEGAGHALHLERPEAVLAEVRAALAR